MRAPAFLVVSILLGGLHLMAHAADSPPRVAEGKRIDELIALLGSERFSERDQAEKELVAIGSAARPKLQAALQSPDLETARRAKSALTEIARLLREATQVAAYPVEPDPADFASPNPYTRLRALRQLDGRLSFQASLPQTTPNTRDAVPRFLKALNDPDDEVRMAGLVAYVRFGDRKTALDKTLAIMRDETENPDVRGSAMLSLYAFLPEAQAAVPDLLRLLQAKQPTVRNEAVRALRQIGDNYPGVVPALLDALADEDEWVRTNAAYALANLGHGREPKRCVPILHQALRREKSLWAMGGLLRALQQFGTEAQEALPTILAIANDERLNKRGRDGQNVRFGAVQALASLGPIVAREHLQRLAAQGHDTDVGTAARGALTSMGIAAEKPQALRKAADK